jgi:hypothetical protein
MSRRITKIPFGGTIVSGEILDYKTEKEDWNKYKLEDGTLLKVRIVANKIARGIDPNTGDILRVPESGEPYYNINYKIQVVAEVPEELM